MVTPTQIQKKKKKGRKKRKEKKTTKTNLNHTSFSPIIVAHQIT